MANIINNILIAAKGFAMGAANVIPGVSGGTILKEWNEYVGGSFLLWLLIGLAISIFTLAKLMEYVLHYYPIQTWSFFFGLIIASSVFMLADIKKWKFADGLFLACGIVLGIAICTLSPTQTTDALWFIGICGAIAVCTMILPGISGSFILVILGKYDFIMQAVSELNIPVLLVFLIGCVVGLLGFSKFLHWLLSKAERQTLLVLIGFTLGSLVKVWPWSDKVSILTSQLLKGGMTAEQAKVAVYSLTQSGTDITPLIENDVFSAACWMIIGIALVMPEGRLLSLDALRGFDMMFIMGLGGLIVSICALFPGSGDSWLARQFSHVDWEGLHFEDTIFALFLFISGMTFPFSIAKKRAKGMPQGKMLLDIIRRGLLLFLFGLIYDGLFDLQFATQRIPSVLGRIGLGWMFAAMLYAFTGKKAQWATAIGILIGYFLLLRFVLIPSLSRATSQATSIAS